MYSFFYILSITLVGLTVAQTPFKDCGSKEGQQIKVQVAGCEGKKLCPLKRNTNVSFEVDFTTKEAAKKLTSVVHGVIAGVPVPFPLDNPNACDNCGVTCPIKQAENIKYKTAIFVKSAYPKLKLLVKWEVKDESGNDLFCIELPAEITD